MDREKIAVQLGRAANPLGAENVSIIKNPGQPNMEITMKEGQKITRY